MSAEVWVGVDVNLVDGRKALGFTYGFEDLHCQKLYGLGAEKIVWCVAAANGIPASPPLTDGGGR